MDFTASDFDWDDGNTAKCRKHGVPLHDVEEVFRQDPRVLADRTGQMEPRLNAIGISAAGRHIFVVFTIRRRGGAQMIRPISARYMHQREVAAYETVRKA